MLEGEHLLSDWLRDEPLFFYGGGAVSVKKLFASCSWLKKIVCFKVIKGKIVCHAAGNFMKLIDISKFRHRLD